MDFLIDEKGREHFQINYRIMYIILAGGHKVSTRLKLD